MKNKLLVALLAITLVFASCFALTACQEKGSAQFGSVSVKQSESEPETSSVEPTQSSDEPTQSSDEPAQSSIEPSESTSGEGGQSSGEPEPENKLPEGTLVLDAIPEGALTLQAADGEHTATATFYFSYTAEALQVGALVIDDVVYTDDSLPRNDRIEVDVDFMQRKQGHTETTLSIIADPAGTKLVRRLATNSMYADSQTVVMATMLSLDGETVAGYAIQMTIPYAEFGASYELKNAVVCVALTNATDSGSAATVYGEEFGEEFANVNTYAHVNEEGELEANEYADFTFVWGNGGTLAMAAGWNVLGDDGSEEAEIHNDFNSEDNYVYMHQSAKSTKLYAEVKINVKELLNGEMWGKFGINVVSANGKAGFMFYVDAAAADGKNFNSNAVGLGLVTRSGFGNGQWTGWSDIGTLGGTSAQYTGDNYVTLGVYRDGSVFGLYANGNLIKRHFSYLADDDEAYIGLACFNMLLSVKEYKLLLGEAAEEYAPAMQEVDNLFIGDSYLDTAFWYTYDNLIGKQNSANVAIGGTKVPLWYNAAPALSRMFDADNIVVHIGVNDIDDEHLTGSAAWLRLKGLLDRLLELNPESDIYYLNICHNMMFTSMWTSYEDLNAAVAAYAEGCDRLHIIDMDAAVTKDADGTTYHWYCSDGLHYGVDGYALLDQKICDALGIVRPAEGEDMWLGDLGVEGAPEFKYTSGWTYSDGIAHYEGRSYNRVGAESETFISGLYSENFYAEVKLSLDECYAADAWCKTGIAIRTEKVTYFYFINSSTVTNGRTEDGKHIYYNDNWGNVCLRTERPYKDWDKPNGTNIELFGYFYLGPQSFDHYTDNSYTTLAVAKLGSKLIFIANGDIVATLENSAIGADEKAAVSVFTFNMDVYAKNAAYTTNLDEIAYILAPSYTVTAATVTGATLEVSEHTAKNGDLVQILVEVEEGYELDKVYVNGAEIAADENGEYWFCMPEENVIVNATFRGRRSVDATALEGKVSVSNTAPLEGDEVIFTALPDIYIAKLYVNGVEVEKGEDGSYKVVCEDNMVVTAECYDMIGGMILDGIIDEEYGAGSAKAEYDDNRDITLRGVRKDNGLYLIATAHMNTVATGYNEWYFNTNMEFRLNGGEQRFVNLPGASNGVTKFFAKTELKENGKYETTFEIYIAKDLIPGFDNDYIYINYAWKTLDEVGYCVGDQIHAYAVHWNIDWMAAHLGGLNIGGNDFYTGLSQYGTWPTSLRIDENGLRIGEDPTLATIDGDLSEYADKHSLYFEHRDGDNLIKSVRVGGFAGSDGLYLNFTIVQHGFGTIHTGEGNWWMNDNIELKINNDWCPILFRDGKVLLNGHWHRCGQKIVDNGDGTYTNTVELYVSTLVTKSYALQFGMNGQANGFNGWLGAIWDGNYAFVTEKGVVYANPFPEGNPEYNTEFAINGVLDEDLWGGKVAQNSFHASANGDEITVKAVAGSFGVMIGATVVSTKAINEVCWQDGTDWWHYQNLEFRLPFGAINDQFAYSPVWNIGSIGAFAYTTVQDAESGLWTTTYEILLPYYTLYRDASGYYPIAIGGVFETNYVWLSGDNDVKYLKVTTEGLKAI